MAQQYSVPSVDRALAILELVAQSRRGYTMSDISRKLALPKSSIHLLVTTLEHKGYLQRNRRTSKYLFGTKLVSLSFAALEKLEFREEARPYLLNLMHRTGLTVHAAILERKEAVIVDKIELPGMLRVATWVGRRLDLNCSGVGKTLLAYCSETETELYFAGPPLARYNENTIVSAMRLRQELKKARESGYAFEDEEGEIGFRCIGAPVFGDAKSVIAAISVAGTTAQIPRQGVPELAHTLKAVAAEISAHMGHSEVH